MAGKIWITGASSGIGKALAIKFANEGWHVAVSARRENLLKDLNKESPNIHSFPLDVTNEIEAKKTFQNIIEKFKTIDISVFCTGIHDPNAEKNLDSKKRPVSAVADNIEFRNAKKIIVKVNKKIKFNLLYDQNASLQKKIKLEQLRKET